MTQRRCSKWKHQGCRCSGALAASRSSIEDAVLLQQAEATEKTGGSGAATGGIGRADTMMLQHADVAEKIQWCCNRRKQQRRGSGAAGRNNKDDIYSGAATGDNSRKEEVVPQQVEATKQR